jgi:uncharacterized membrane protein
MLKFNFKIKNYYFNIFINKKYFLKKPLHIIKKKIVVFALLDYIGKFRV